MVRKAQATEVSQAHSGKTQTSSDHVDLNIEKWLGDARKGAKQNSHMLIGIALLLLGLIQLRAFLLGMVLVTAGILFVS